MNIGMKGVLVLHHSFLMLLICLFFPFSIFLSFPFYPKQRIPLYPESFHCSTFQIPNPFKEMNAGMKRVERAKECGFGALWHQCVMAMVAQCKIEMRQCD